MKQDLETHLYVGSMCGDVMCSEDNISTMNQIQNDKAKEYLKKYPDAIVGKINWYEGEDNEFKRLADVMPLLNFSYSFALPKEDQWAYEWAYTWNNLLTLAEKTTDVVQKFMDYIDEQDGIHFYWI